MYGSETHSRVVSNSASVLGATMWVRNEQSWNRDAIERQVANGEHDAVRAANDARETARKYGTPICVFENSRILAKKPWIFPYSGVRARRMSARFNGAC